MMARALNEPASWWFFGAIHGEYVTPANNPGAFPGWAFIPGVPKVPVTPLPTPSVIDTYWDQCQHQSWFFPPWHRGYLVALEAQLREDIVHNGGPSTWALPYWDYFGPAQEFDIPPAFAQQTMPDGSPNPLFVTARYGPNADNIVFVPTAAGLKKHPVPPANFQGTVTETCLSNTVYTGSNGNTPLPGFGGPLAGARGEVAFGQALQPPGHAPEKPGAVLGGGGLAEQLGVADAQYLHGQPLQGGNGCHRGHAVLLALGRIWSQLVWTLSLGTGMTSRQFTAELWRFPGTQTS